MPRPPAVRRRRLWWLVAAVLLVVALGGLPLFVFPSQQPAGPADVVFVIGPPRGWRITWANQLVASGHAKALMISTPDPATEAACLTLTEVPVLCRRPDPFTTRGEARWLRAEMAARGWRTALVITGTPHLTRTRYVMDRCVPEGVQVVGRTTGMNPALWVYQYAYQSTAWVKALAQRGC